MRPNETRGSPCGKALNITCVGKLPWKAVPGDSSLVCVVTQVTSIQGDCIAPLFIRQVLEKHQATSGGSAFKCS